MQMLGAVLQRIRVRGRCLDRFACAALLALLMAAPGAHAAEVIEMRAPYMAPVNGVYALNTQLLFATPESVERAVHEGATLTLELQIRVFRTRTWWRDETLAELQQRYTLIYHSVSERYLVRNLNSGAQSSYATFAQAIASLQRIEDLPVLDQALVLADTRNEVSLRAGLEVRSIPRALGLLLFWVDNFSLESDWYTWPLKP